MLIPARLHRILVRGYDPGPDSHAWWRRFAELNPNWELTTWTDPVRAEDFELGRLFESCSSGAQLADLLRIETLWRHGGVYVDSDVEPLASLDPLRGLEFVIGTEDGHQLSSGVIGAVPGHPALRVLMDRLLEYDAIPSTPSARHTTGPLLYSRMFDLRSDIVVLPREVFYPYNPYIGIDRTSDWPRRHVLCVHHWAATWDRLDDDTGASQPTIVQRVRQGARRVVRTRALPLMRRIAADVTERPANTHGVYAGHNRMLISTTDGFRLYSVADDVSLTPELVQRGWYDDKLLGFLDEVLRAGDWFVDVGANIGLFSLAAARRVGRWGRVIAFEADPELADLCRTSAGMNWFRNVTVVGSAAGAAEGRIRYDRHPHFRMLSVAGSDDHRGRGVRDGFEAMDVPVQTIDSHIPAGAPLRLVKIDVEGGESDVLAGMSGLLDRKMVDYVVLEAIRGNAGERWHSLLRQLAWLEAVHGATFWLLDHRGRRLLTSLTEVSISESISQLVIDLTN